MADLESLCDCDLRLLARLAQLMKANAVKLGVSFALQVGANLRGGLVLQIIPLGGHSVALRCVAGPRIHRGRFLIVFRCSA